MSVRVLLVDDVPDVRFLVRTALRGRTGIEVVSEAGTGQEALAAATAHQPDIVVLDLGLPDLPAADLVRRLRDTCTAKIVVFTGLELGVGTAFDEPVEGFVRKSDDIRFLVDLLENLDAAGRQTAALALEKGPAAAGAARAFVAELCRRWGCLDVVDSAELVVSELVTNAVVHARSHPQLLVSHRGRTLHLEVSDDSHSSPEPRDPTIDDEHGRGLLLVAAFSAAWGVEPTSSGKRIWAELPCLPVLTGASA